MDALSEALSELRLAGAIFFRTRCATRWAVALPRPSELLPFARSEAQANGRMVLFHVIERGEGWLSIPNREPVRLYPGDLIVIADDVPHVLGDDPNRAPVPADQILPSNPQTDAPVVLTVGGTGDGMRFVCGFLTLEDRKLNPLVGALPPLLHLRADQGPSRSWLTTSIEYTIAAAQDRRPGSDVVLTRLPEVLFVEAIRTYLEGLDEHSKGWLAAVRDPVVGAALDALHSDIAFPWTVAELSRKVGTSRSVLSARFQALLDDSPIQYLLRLRVLKAQRLLEDGAALSEVAALVGYGSEASFSRAFFRVTGVRPGAWR